MNASNLSDLNFAKNQLTVASRKTLAHELYQLLQSQGVQGKDFINISTELLDLVIDEIKDEDSVKAAS